MDQDKQKTELHDTVQKLENELTLARAMKRIQHHNDNGNDIVDMSMNKHPPRPLSFSLSPLPMTMRLLAVIW
jgi:hypothetical protein